MWPWRRKGSGADDASGAVPAAGRIPVVRADWRALPPIQRAIAAHPLINPVQRFSGSLASWQNPSFLAPLGHQVGPAEPAGVITDLTIPVRAARPTIDLPVVSRAAAGRPASGRRPPAGLAFGPAAPTGNQSIVDDPMSIAEAPGEPEPMEPGGPEEAGPETSGDEPAPEAVGNRVDAAPRPSVSEGSPVVVTRTVAEPSRPVSPPDQSAPAPLVLDKPLPDKPLPGQPLADGAGSEMPVTRAHPVAGRPDPGVAPVLSRSRDTHDAAVHVPPGPHRVDQPPVVSRDQHATGSGAPDPVTPPVVSRLPEEASRPLVDSRGPDEPVDSAFDPAVSRVPDELAEPGESAGAGPRSPVDLAPILPATGLLTTTPAIPTTGPTTGPPVAQRTGGAEPPSAGLPPVQTRRLGLGAPINPPPAIPSAPPEPPVAAVRQRVPDRLPDVAAGPIVVARQQDQAGPEPAPGELGLAELESGEPEPTAPLIGDPSTPLPVAGTAPAPDNEPVRPSGGGVAPSAAIPLGAVVPVSRLIDRLIDTVPPPAERTTPLLRVSRSPAPESPFRTTGTLGTTTTAPAQAGPVTVSRMSAMPTGTAAGTTPDMIPAVTTATTTGTTTGMATELATGMTTAPVAPTITARTAPTIARTTAAPTTGTASAPTAPTITTATVPAITAPTIATTAPMITATTATATTAAPITAPVVPLPVQLARPAQLSVAPQLVLPPGQPQTGAPAAMQRAVEPEPGAATPITVTRTVEGTVQRAEDAAAPSAAPSVAPDSAHPAEPADKEPDRMVQELFVPLLRRLKAELQLDRERRGALTDLWH